MVDLLVDYLEGTLPPDTEHDLDAHLAACTRCISQLRTYRTTVSLLRGLCDDDLPVERVSWDDIHDADGFLLRTGLVLPTEMG